MKKRVRYDKTMFPYLRNVCRRRILSQQCLKIHSEILRAQINKISQMWYACQTKSSSYRDWWPQTWPLASSRSEIRCHGKELLLDMAIIVKEFTHFPFPSRYIHTLRLFSLSDACTDRHIETTKLNWESKPQNCGIEPWNCWPQLNGL